jgi:hypothetical protein
MFGELKQKALALQISNADVGKGEISQARMEYTGNVGDYPIDTPSAISGRTLPEVDQFLYTPPDDMATVEKTTENMWSNLFVLQTGLHAYQEGADVDNVFNSFYKFIPLGKAKLSITVTNGHEGFTGWTEITGEAVKLAVAITPVGATAKVLYIIWVVVDGMFIDTTQHQQGIVPVMLITTAQSPPSPKEAIMAGNKRIWSDDLGVFAAFVVEGTFSGWTKTHDTVTLGTPDPVWSKSTTLTIKVNDPTLGTVSPAIGDHTENAIDTVTVTATPNANIVVSEWDLDGTQLAGGNSIGVDCYSDHVLECFFLAGGVYTLRPNANGDLSQMNVKNLGIAWQAVDEAVSDGDATYIDPDVSDTVLTNLFKFNTISPPNGSVVDYVEVYTRFRYKLIDKAGSLGFVLKSGSTEWTEALNGYQGQSDYILINKRYTINPITGNAWTVVEVNALQAGVRGMTPSLGGQGIMPLLLITQFWAVVQTHIPS